MDDATDAELIAAHREGAKAALETLVRRHLPSVSAYCYHLVLNRPMAEDLSQETFLRAVRSLDSFRGTAQFRTWLFTIAANLAKDAHRRRRTPASDEVELLPTRSEHAPDRTVMQSELEREIDVAMQELPALLRSTLTLSVVHDCSPQEIADIEGCTVNTIYSRIHEARKILKKRLRQWTT